MANVGESSTSSNLNSVDMKPVVVRVKRKAIQSHLEAFWLEINERRPLKRRLLDLGKLSISDSTEKEESKGKKIFVQHVETVSSSKASLNVLQSLVPKSADASEFQAKVEERRRTFKQDNKHDQLLSRSRQEHEVLSKNARFKQIWKSRKGNKDTVHDDPIHEICHLYDVVRIDSEEKSNKMEEPEDTSLEDSAMLCGYLPLIREFLPSVAAEIQSDMQSYFTMQALTDDYVYDLYAMQDELNTADEDALDSYPLVQVEDDDFFDGPIQSEFESDDSNAEDNPLNDYPDEETSEDDTDESRTSHNDESEEVESISSGNHSEELGDKRNLDDYEDEDSLNEEEELFMYNNRDDDMQHR